MDKPVVLVVDDEIDARIMIINFLEERFDCKFREASDGEEAVKFIKLNPCDVMLLDIRMPNKGGVAVIKEVKKLNPKLDIIVVSAWLTDEVVKEVMKLGVADYTDKPIDLKAIASKIENILEKRGQQKEK
jgi:two-component system NtrC family response regulator